MSISLHIQSSSCSSATVSLKSRHCFKEIICSCLHGDTKSLTFAMTASGFNLSVHLIPRYQNMSPSDCRVKTKLLYLEPALAPTRPNRKICYRRLTSHQSIGQQRHRFGTASCRHLCESMPTPEPISRTSTKHLEPQEATKPSPLPARRQRDTKSPRAIGLATPRPVSSDLKEPSS